ncbi:iron-containing alcohol dehydrogenase [Pseudoscardovia suis]|uniref:Iron-containing alcohol dehydrogenase n=1 Tax=Pseudoscardovia suis TaxID=987063 RepID=A0A261F4M7_9BIFI|nr:iron-containing alcohol dehydrogenase [Pseudoscardovia suis]OZG54003.1 Iron-containing alcohol dehydrogenase [Pseudoscardovia suis]PJJ65758.1 iron-containing alcohol dehydrogenase-like protein [Pseudoscardovia suis]
MEVRNAPVVVFDQNLGGTQALSSYLAMMPAGTVLIPLPPTCTVQTVTTLHAQIEEYDNLFAVGGGAILDAVKLAALPNWSSVKRGLEVGRSGLMVLRGDGTAHGKTKRIEAVPTTIGTGSEASSVALVEGPSRRRHLIIGRSLRPRKRYYSEFYRTLPDSLLYEGAIEVALRIVGEYVVSGNSANATDELAVGMLKELRAAARRAETDRQESCIRLARVSALSHEKRATGGRNPFTWPLWYIANELSTECGCRKMEASIPLIPSIVYMARSGKLPWGRSGRVNQLESRIGNLDWFFAELMPAMGSASGAFWSDDVADRTARRAMLAWGGTGMPLEGTDMAELRNVLIP